jgi:hypothetical protein
MEVNGQFHAPAALPPRERAPWVGGLGGTQSRPGRGGEDKNSQSSPEIEL